MMQPASAVTCRDSPLFKDDVMRISAVVAMSENHVIGVQNKLPWHMPADLQHFKTITINKPVMMGRKTYESIGRPLPNRLNVIISRDPSFKADGCSVYHSVDDAMSAIKNNEEIFIIGGAILFSEMLPRIKRIYLTVIHEHVEGDAFFPELNKKEWKEVESVKHHADERNPHDYSFITLDRV
jgi:dihydrofolate reductase